MSQSPAENLDDIYEEVELGGVKRKLRYGYNTICELQAATGENPFDPKSKLLQMETSPISVRLLTWACLWAEEPRPTLQQVGTWIGLGSVFKDVVFALGRLRQRSMPDPKKEPRRRPR